MTPDEIMKEILKRKLEIEKLTRKLDIYGRIPPIPKFGNTESVNYVSSNFDEVNTTRYCDVAHIIDVDFNMFHTEEYARRAMLAAKMVAMQLHCKWYIDRDFVPDWNNNTQPKYSVFFNHVNKTFHVAQWGTHERTDIVFSTRQAAELCAEWLQENWKDFNYD